ncbi:amino acid permease, partial [Clostridium sp. HCS.1]|uniref:amino acid permease n=1 Tax=Clostridium sp. HCS.1 TaxID=3238594 RepID=UPI003A1022C7
MESASWITAIAPIAFSFDGWIISTSIGHEIKDSKKNLPKALVMAPLFILLLYVLYFLGISIYLGPEKVMALGDAHVDLAANMIFGAW